MRPFHLSLVAAIVLSGCVHTVSSTSPTFEFHVAGGVADEKMQAELVRLGLELLKSSNFNTADEPGILKQSDATIRDHYRPAVAGDYVRIRYEHAVTVNTVGGEVMVRDIVIGLARPDYVSSLFTVDGEGQVVAHEKYDGGLAIDFRKCAAKGGGG